MDGGIIVYSSSARFSFIIVANFSFIISFDVGREVEGKIILLISSYILRI